jgi:hypothetical protein
MHNPLKMPVANPENGEVLIEVRGPNGEVKRGYVMRMNTNAICVLEQAMGEHIHKLMPRIIDPGMQDLRALLFAGLHERQPEMTIADAGDLIDQAGFEACANAVMEACTLGFPKGVKGPAAKAAPEGKGHGTGPGSSPTRRRRASVPPSSGN